ncbi:MAG: hypothetical protein ACK4UY_16480, partial [Dietzia sp.]
MRTRSRKASDSGSLHGGPRLNDTADASLTGSPGGRKRHYFDREAAAELGLKSLMRGLLEPLLQVLDRPGLFRFLDACAAAASPAAASPAAAPPRGDEAGAAGSPGASGAGQTAGASAG